MQNRITSDNLANAIVKLVAVDALPALLGNMVAGNLVRRDFEPTLAQVGDTVSMPIPPIVQANNPAEGGNGSVDVGNKPVVLNTHADAAFQIPDVTKVLAVPDLLKLYMQPAVETLAERIEGDLLSLATQFTANKPVGTPAVALTEATIDASDTVLFNSKVPTSADRYLVVDSDSWSCLRRMPSFSEYQTAGEAGLRALIDGSVGRIRDFFVFRSRSVHKSGPGVRTHNLAFGQDAIGLVTRRLPQPLPGSGTIAEYAEMGNFGVRVTMHYTPNTLAQQFSIDVLYGCTILRNQFGVEVRS